MAYTPCNVTFGWDVYINGSFYEFCTGDDQGKAEAAYFNEQPHALAAWYKDECGKHTYIPSGQ
jgi:hypothetical protein